MCGQCLGRGIFLGGKFSSYSGIKLAPWLKHKNIQGSRFRARYSLCNGIKVGLYNRLYVTNNLGKKLLQLVVNDQKSAPGLAPNAQIKMIPYGLRKAVIWKDQPTDPSVIRLSHVKALELTYHGPGANGQLPRVHLLERFQDQSRYRDLLESVLPLNHDLHRMVPLFSVIPGYDVDAVWQD
jgi:hypothetical protein